MHASDLVDIAGIQLLHLSALCLLHFRLQTWKRKKYKTCLVVVVMMMGWEKMGGSEAGPAVVLTQKF